MILPSAYLGNIEYFYHLWKEDSVCIDIHEPFQKQTYRSRSKIVGANGSQVLTVPVERPDGKNTLMKDVLISNKENWRKDHLKAIESAYSRTPYFIYYFDKITEILEADHTYLWQLNDALTRFLVDKSGLVLEINYSTEQLPLEENDFRINFTSKKESNFYTFRYIQAFEERHGFIEKLSVLDLLFNEGPNIINFLPECHYSSL